MHLPKGNPLIEQVGLTSPDIQVMVENLEADQFTGYLQMDIGGVVGYVFFVRGAILRAIEIPRGGDPLVRMLPRLMTLVRQQATVETSCYVLSNPLVEVLSQMFAYKPLFKDYQVKRKELKKVLNDLEQDSYSGLLRVKGPEGRVFVLLDRGSLVTDRFTSQYGEVLCGSEAVGGLLDYVHNNGSTIHVHAEKATEIDNERRRIEEDLEKIRQLIIREKSGMFRANDVVKVAEDIVRDWGIDVKQTFRVEVETDTGEMFEYKCQGGRKLGGYAEIHSAMIKTLNVKEGDLVNVRPIG